MAVAAEDNEVEVALLFCTVEEVCKTVFDPTRLLAEKLFDSLGIAVIQEANDAC